MSSRLIRDRLCNRPSFQSALETAADGKFVPVLGGVLILSGDGYVFVLLVLVVIRPKKMSIARF